MVRAVAVDEACLLLSSDSSGCEAHTVCLGHLSYKGPQENSLNLKDQEFQ